MELMQELMEKSKVSRKAASAVYHRDYIKTKKKPYRKYDPKNKPTNEGVEGVDEGVFDFVKGAAQHVGQQVKAGVQNTVAAGQQASMSGQLTKLVAQLYQSISAYNKLKKATGPQQQQQAPQQQQQAPQQQAPQQATPAAFRTTQKPRAVMGKHGAELQFSSYLQTLDNDDLITEGVWDFMKGVGGHVAQSMKQGVQSTVQAGQAASSAADLATAEKNAKQSIMMIVQLLQKMGSGAIEQFKQAAINTAGAHGDRLVQIVMNHAKKSGIQLQ